MMSSLVLEVLVCQVVVGGVVRKLDDGVGAMFRFAVVGEEGVEERTQHTALWYASVYGESGEAAVV